jgi:hypothetical protein
MDDASRLIAEITGCDAETAVAAVDSLRESGWSRPRRATTRENLWAFWRRTEANSGGSVRCPSVPHQSQHPTRHIELRNGARS